MKSAVEKAPENKTDEKKVSESFRDKVSTISEKGGRVWIYPKKPNGTFYSARSIVSVILLVFLFGAPFIKINGHPFILLNILQRKFIIFGVAFWPQDFHLFALAMISLVVFIILFTAIFGRVWCGWACPQTIFMEMVFRKIEYWIEGDANKQRALNKAPWTSSKIRKKLSKHVIFFGLSFIIGNTFLAYIIGVDELYKIITDPPAQHVGGLSAMVLFSGVFYGVFARFREQACTMVCPYGRLQGVLLDPNSIVVAYDFTRGEKRGKFRKEQPRDDLGHCIDCGLCVQVCPTGIDIRNGTQLECVNCTACIDACNSVMEKVNFPKDLIRYASMNGIQNGEKMKVTPRIIGYSFLLVILLSVLTYALTTRPPVEATILRTAGTLYQEIENDEIQNLYSIKIANKTFQEIPITLRLLQPEGEIQMVGSNEMVVPADGWEESVFFVRIPKSQITQNKTQIRIGVYTENKLVDEVKTGFLGPIFQD